MCNFWWMYNVSLRDRKLLAELTDRLGVGNIVDVLHQIRWIWFGHIQRMDIENPVNNCWFFEVDDQRGRGRHVNMDPVYQRRF